VAHSVLLGLVFVIQGVSLSLYIIYHNPVMVAMFLLPIFLPFLVIKCPNYANLEGCLRFFGKAKKEGRARKKNRVPVTKLTENDHPRSIPRPSHRRCQARGPQCTAARISNNLTRRVKCLEEQTKR
jgi:hypothetical protein